MWPFLISSMLIAAPEVWVAPSHVHVPRVEEGASRTRIARLHAARGERESFQVVLTAGDEPLEGLYLTVAAPDASIPAPTISRVGLRPISSPSARAVGTAAAWPDLLLEAVPQQLNAGDTAVWWVAYDIPRDATPGVYWSEIEVHHEGRRTFPEVSVRLEVFDVVLSAEPALPSFLPLDDAALVSFCEISDNSLETWRALYDPLASWPLGFAWPHRRDMSIPAPVPAPPLAPVEPAKSDEPAEPLVLVPVETREMPAEVPDGRGVLGHWAYLAQTSPAARLDWSAIVGHSAANRFQRAWLDTGFPEEVSSLMTACSAAGLMPRGNVLLHAPGTPAATADVINLSQLLQQMGTGVGRLFAGPPAPVFQRWVDQYAIPLTDFRPGLTDDLRGGIPLSAPKPYPTVSVTSSASGLRGDGPWIATEARDAYDGSLVSEWHSDAPPTGAKPAWITLRFPDSIVADKLNLYWALGREPGEVVVDTSFDGDQFSAATVKWEKHAPAPPFNGGWWEGTFRYTNTLKALRLVMRGTPSDRPVGLAEISFGEEVSAAPDRLEPSVAPWLLAGGLAYPALTVDAHAIEPRLVAWLAWAFNFSGVYVPGVNHWPAADAVLTGADTANFLFYPAPGRLIPSIRLERLRDGFEDYALIGAYAREFAEPPPALVQLRAQLERGLATASDAKQLDAVAENIVASRIALGRALSVTQPSSL